LIVHKNNGQKVVRSILRVGSSF